MKPSVVDCVGSDEGLVALAVGTIFSVVLASVAVGVVVVSVIVDVVSVALLVIIVGGLCVVPGGVLITKTTL